MSLVCQGPKEGGACEEKCINFTASADPAICLACKHSVGRHSAPIAAASAGSSDMAVLTALFNQMIVASSMSPSSPRPFSLSAATMSSSVTPLGAVSPRSSAVVATVVSPTALPPLHTSPIQHSRSGSRTPSPRNRPRQENMRERVLLRNKIFNRFLSNSSNASAQPSLSSSNSASLGVYQCDICGMDSSDASDFKNSHVIADVYRGDLELVYFTESPPDDEFTDSPSSLKNGLCLCNQCDGLYENHSIEINGDGVINWNPAKKTSIALTEKYGKMNGTKVKWHYLINKCKLFPTSSMLEYRMTKPRASPNQGVRRLVFDEANEEKIMKLFDAKQYETK